MGKEKEKGEMEDEKEKREREIEKGILMAAIREVKWWCWYW